MAFHMSKEEKLVVAFIEKHPFPETNKKQWAKAIETEGLNEELAEKIHKKLAKLPLAEHEDEFTHGRRAMELTRLISQWRIAKNSKQFHDRRG